MAKRMRLSGLFLVVCLYLAGCQAPQPVDLPQARQQSRPTAQAVAGQQEMNNRQTTILADRAYGLPSQEESISVPIKDKPKQEEPVQKEQSEGTNDNEGEIEQEKVSTCTLSINCAAIFDNLEHLDPEKKELLPKEGIILPEIKVVFTPGESVFDVLLRTVQKFKIHMEFVSTPGYESKYIEGIYNLYEFDCGELSGWVYKVNGQVADCGSSLYKVQDGDKIEWCYTCDLGRDVGATQEGIGP